MDLICELAILRGIAKHPTALLDRIEARVRENERYARLLSRGQRCIRLRFANQFHLDIVPAFPDPSATGLIFVPDNEARQFRAANPKGYAQWFRTKGALRRVRALEAAEPLPPHESADEKAPLQLIVQLLKRWRDSAYRGSAELTPPSCVITTLAALHYDGAESIASGISAMLQAIVLSLPPDAADFFLPNPANPIEDFAERWVMVPHAYREFVERSHQLAKEWHSLLATRGIQNASSTLERLFGEQVTQHVLREQAADTERSRTSGELGIAPRTGVLTRSAPGMIPIRANTFHGD